MPYEQFAYIYDRLMADMPYDDWLKIVKKSWEKFGKPQTAADLGCGTGSLSIRLEAENVAIYGIDYSADMLSIAAQKASSVRAGTVRWIQQDMRHWQTPEPVDAVYSFCDSLNYITARSDLAQVFYQTKLNVKPGGVFLFDLLSEFQYEQYERQQPFVLNDDDLAYIWTCEYNNEQKMIEHELTLFVQEGECYRRIDEIHRQRAYSHETVKALLTENGFELVDLSADFREEPPNEHSVRLFYTAVRKDDTA